MKLEDARTGGWIDVHNVDVRVRRTDDHMWLEMFCAQDSDAMTLNSAALVLPEQGTYPFIRVGPFRLVTSSAVSRPAGEGRWASLELGQYALHYVSDGPPAGNLEDLLDLGVLNGVHWDERGLVAD